MPPIPPGPPAGAAFSFSGSSRHERLGGEQQTGDRSRILQRIASHFRGIDNAGLHQVDVFAGGNVITFVSGTLLDFLHDQRAFLASVVGKLTQRRFNGTANDLKAGFLVAFEFHVLQRFLRTDQSNTAAWDDAFFDRRTRSVQRVFDASLLSLSSRSRLQHRR